MSKAIIFDMDGTLFQTNLILEPALEATFEVLRKENLWDKKTPIEQYRGIMGVPLPVVWETLCPNHSLEIRVKSNEIFHKKLIELIQAQKGALYAGVESTLNELSKKYPLFIASNGQIEYLQAIVETYNLDRFIQDTYSIQLIKFGNKSDLVQMVKNKNQIEKGYVVGDRSSDISAAKDNELIAVGVNFDFAQEDELKQADFVVNNFKEILELV
ncbi:HAD hydrolase-like protein [Peribacillus sp. AS_2]|uniref:HAD hydrolase-like protein n=1 Tax=Peribacillus sp. AS_2 TaxID=2996755 RepID=UPI0022A75A6E|nr:HAD hydrolase-like protein [Peribacillus sp. AS_2]MCZ0874922.1 HAD hydrolase-like protein [Peribacillus sp. AS_2]